MIAEIVVKRTIIRIKNKVTTEIKTEEVRTNTKVEARASVATGKTTNAVPVLLTEEVKEIIQAMTVTIKTEFCTVRPSQRPRR
jgi:hypothetical protein